MHIERDCGAGDTGALVGTAVAIASRGKQLGDLNEVI